jgi:leucyl/phenylalanyl-tRNA--protein transferase
MTAIRWLRPGAALDRFPPADEALDEPNGLLAAGGDLEPERLLLAYRNGIFPWYEAGQPILWWSPNPRAVLHPAELHVSRSLRRAVAANRFLITADTAFERVLAGCAAPRRYTDATWITADMTAAYTTLHRRHFAHSFEAWQNGRLVGGLYGVSIGRVFFGESMFARATDASKVAFVHAVRYLESRGFELIDCQVASAHLASLGACDIPRSKFLRSLEHLCNPPRWADQLRPLDDLWDRDFAAWLSRAP